VPCGMTRSGLPIGMQIVSRSGDELTALQLGQAWQDRTNGHKFRPDTSRGADGRTPTSGTGLWTCR
jgi:hypothetical protein